VLDDGGDDGSGGDGEAGADDCPPVRMSAITAIAPGAWVRPTPMAIVIQLKSARFTTNACHAIMAKPSRKHTRSRETIRRPGGVGCPSGRVLIHEIFRPVRT
jgi:hypothetical protein